MKKKHVSFNETTSTWYEKLADANAFDTPSGKEIENRCHRLASKSNLEGILKALRGCKRSYVAPLRAHIKSVLGGAFKSEFKYRFGGRAHGYAPISQASSLLGSLDQALNYNDPTHEMHRR